MLFYYFIHYTSILSKKRILLKSHICITWIACHVHSHEVQGPKVFFINYLQRSKYSLELIEAADLHFV